MNILYKTDKLILENEFEYASLIEKRTGKELMKDDFYGDPVCGLISPNNDWAIIAGEHIIVWRKNKKKSQQIVRIKNEDLKCIHDLRLKQDNIIDILIDPWSDKSAIWELNIDTLEYSKISEFDLYRNEEYTDTVIW